MKKRFLLATLLAIFMGLNGCSDSFLDGQPENIISEEDVYKDPGLITSVLSNLYSSATDGENNKDYASFKYVDDASTSYGSPWTIFTEYDRNQWRIRDYGMIRKINLFLRGLRSSTALQKKDKLQYEGEARFLRAWLYFNMARSLGGMPIIQDEVFAYESGMDLTTLQVARSTEKEIYDYIISECEVASTYLSEETTTNSARANKWTALMLKSRAAIYAASIAKYNALRTPDVVTQGSEVGIPASAADYYYQLALAAADSVINFSPYDITPQNTNLGLNFYEAVCKKTGNKEVIWALDRNVEDKVTINFTSWCMPNSVRDGVQGNSLGALLNLVEAFENKDGSNPLIQTKDASGNYIFYNSPQEVFEKKDARLWGTVIYPNATYRGTPVLLQAGLLTKSGSRWTIKTSQPGKPDAATGKTITALDGPFNSSASLINKTGFLVRKYLDEAAYAGAETRYSDMWFPRFRISEAYLIAAEAAFELGNQGIALHRINAVRARGGIKPLTTVTFANIVNEYRVEFAFEDHRWWDLTHLAAFQQ